VWFVVIEVSHRGLAVGSQVECVEEVQVAQALALGNVSGGINRELGESWRSQVDAHSSHNRLKQDAKSINQSINQSSTVKSKPFHRVRRP